MKKPSIDIEKLRKNPYFIAWSMDNPDLAKRIERVWKKRERNAFLQDMGIASAIVALFALL